MLNSRNIDDLRPDVAAACKYGLELCKRARLNVLVTGTVRDEEYQEQCYKNGTANTKVPSFHSVKAGLAFDFCKNVKGQEYNDAAFFKKVAAIFKSLGFEWGGDWKSFVDVPHLQWSGYKHEYTAAMVIAGNYPPTLIFNTEDEFDMTKEELLSVAGTGDNPSDWAQDAAVWAKANGIMNGDGAGNYGWDKPITREGFAQVLYNFAKLMGKA